MKIQIKEKWDTCHISNAKDQLKHSFSKSTINKRKVPFPQIRTKTFQSLLGKINKNFLLSLYYSMYY